MEVASSHSNISQPLSETKEENNTSNVSNSTIPRTQDEQNVQNNSLIQLTEGQKRHRNMAFHWINQILLKQDPNYELKEDIILSSMRSGILPCKILNVLVPNSITTINESNTSFAAIENINLFLQAVMNYGVDKKFMFRPMDFTTGKSDDGFIRVILALSLASLEKGIIITPFKQNVNSRSISQDAKPNNPEVVEKQQQQPLEQQDQSLTIQVSRKVRTSSVEVKSAIDPLKQETFEKIIQKLDSLDLHNLRLFVATNQINLHQQKTKTLQPRPSFDSSKQIDKTNENTMIIQVSERLTEIITSQNELLEKLTEISEEIMNSEVYHKQKSPKYQSLGSEASESSISTPDVKTPQTPKMFAKLPAEILEKDLPKAELMRLSVVYELIETEVDYVRDLNVMISLHKKELLENKYVNEEEISIIFANVEELVPANQKFVDLLLAKKDDNPLVTEVGDVFQEVASSFAVYQNYCGNYPTAMRLITTLSQKPEFKEALLKYMNVPESRGLSLESFLIKPVQRICKYPLLIRELQKHTPDTSKDHPLLITAMEKIEAVVGLVNEATRLLGEKDRIMTLQSKIEDGKSLQLEGKKLLRDGPLLRIQGLKGKEKYLLLFHDCLFVCKVITKAKYSVDAVWSLGDLEIPKADIATVKGHKFVLQFGVKDEKEVFQFSCMTEDEKTKWVDAFTEGIKAAEEEVLKNSKRETRKSSHTSIDRATTGKSKWSNSTMSIKVGKKWGKFKRREGTMANESTGEVQVDLGPALVEIKGEVWKQATAATGQIYYFNPATKSSIWKLPLDHLVLNPTTGKPISEGEKGLFTVDSIQGEDMDANIDDETGHTMGEEDSELQACVAETVDGYPNWRKVEFKGDVYYFNIHTMESVWDLQ